MRYYLLDVEHLISARFNALQFVCNKIANEMYYLRRNIKNNSDDCLSRNGHAIYHPHKDKTCEANQH